MKENTLFELTLFDPDHTLIAKLESRKIVYKKVPATRKFVVALDETIKIISNDNNVALMKSLVLIFEEWLEENQYRKLQVQLHDGSIKYVSDYDSEGAIDILKNAVKISAFDPEYNNRILNR